MTVDQLIDAALERLPAQDRPLATAFLRAYYAGSAAEDLAERTPEQLCAVALGHLELARERPPGTPILRAVNPKPGSCAGDAARTAIEVVADDMPFLVDSVVMALNARGLSVELVVHPVLHVHRDQGGRLCAVVEPGDAQARVEAVMRFEVDRVVDPAMLGAIEDDVHASLADVRVVVEDWRAMRARLHAVVADLRATPPPLPAEALDEALALLEWLDRDHYTYLGYRQYDLVERCGEVSLCAVPDSGLGILRDARSAGVSQAFARLPAAVRRQARAPELLIVTKANARATVHRPVHMDYIGIKRLTPAGEVLGEHRFLGLYTSAVYHRVPRDIPLLRHKVRRVVECAGYRPGSHAHKGLVHILDTLPRDLLFQLDETELAHTAIGILHLQERQRVRLFVHRDRFERYYICLVYVPRERFNTQVRLRIQAIVAAALAGEVSEFAVDLGDAPHARLQFLVHTAPGAGPGFDAREVEQAIARATRAWSDELGEALEIGRDALAAARLRERYAAAFDAGYREVHSADAAVRDIEQIEAIVAGAPLSLRLYRRCDDAAQELRLRLLHPRAPVPLSGVLPVLEHMGLRVLEEHPEQVRPANAEPVWIQDFRLCHEAGADLDPATVQGDFEEAFSRIWFGEMENDGFNRLVLGAGLDWREIIVLRACCKYLRQAGSTFSQVYMEQALARQPHLAARLVALFGARLDPDAADPDAAERLAQEIAAALEEVQSLDEDRILRAFLAVVLATMRTSFYQRDGGGAPKPYLSLKLAPGQVPDLPQPRPEYEIFVYSPRVEGVHLRGGRVARGGIRWSDRREDFRTEVLGLMKAQTVKNAVIVPVGAKGGFVAKRLPAEGDREAIAAEGTACYRIFIRALLDVTDNLDGSAVVPPPRVVRHDGDDPYLVVAADKGTATFSDIANAIAAEYRFWLGDAFASGGSHGYDHKKMGITARGAWESVKRHFRELGVDVQNEDFTVVGIGDMGGDVFGNGMLLSRRIKLVGAFNHQHVFLDPDPDPAAAHAERERLFRLPRSSWADYDPGLISAGGGIWPRTAKHIDLSSQARALLGIEARRVTPNALIRALLCAPVDLLWNGGIGTYVKASDESDLEVGDRANDALRVAGAQLRCRVIGEGGNLGVTQRGRIEYALRGGRCYTDFIDNSGGVDCSDHEVNIKILLNGEVTAGRLEQDERNRLLEEMADEVAKLVLRDNYLQTQALACVRAQSAEMLDVHARLVQHLERSGRLVRALEFLPDEEQLTERRNAGAGLVAPELAVLLAHVKLGLYGDILASDLPDEPLLADLLRGYFPALLREHRAGAIGSHPLAREIVATVLANEVVNRAGPSFVLRLADETGAGPVEIVRAFFGATAMFELAHIWHAVEALDNRVAAEVQIGMLNEARAFADRVSAWLLRNAPRPLDLAAWTGERAAEVRAAAQALQDTLPAERSARVQRAMEELAGAGVPEALARRITTLREIDAAADVAAIAATSGRTASAAAGIYVAVGQALDLYWMRDRIDELARRDRWQRLAREALREDLQHQHRLMTIEALRLPAVEDPDRCVQDWLQSQRGTAERLRLFVADLKAAAAPSFAMLSAAMRELRGLRGTAISR